MESNLYFTLFTFNSLHVSGLDTLMKTVSYLGSLSCIHHQHVDSSDCLKVPVGLSSASKLYLECLSSIKIPLFSKYLTYS